MSQKLYKSSGKKIFYRRSINYGYRVDPPPNDARNASTSKPAGKGDKSKAPKSKKEIIPTKKMIV